MSQVKDEVKKRNKEAEDKAISDALTLGKGFIEVEVDFENYQENKKYHCPRKVYYTTKQEIEHE